MFALSDADLQLRILGCADGPASFNAESTRRGAAVISIDPLYRLDTRTIRDRIAATYDQMLEQAQCNSQQFVWDAIQSVVTPVLSRYQRTMRNKRGPLWPFL